MTNELVTIRPGELKFIFELQKKSSCYLQLINNTENYVAFKVKTTSPGKYCVRPVTGIVLPKATFDVIVTHPAPTDAPPNMQCKDRFLFQTVRALSGANVMDVTPEMFNKEPGKVIEENILKVVYVAPPEPLSTNPESPKEGVIQKDSSLGNSCPRVDHMPKDISELDAKLSEALKNISELKAQLSEAQSALSKLKEENAADIQQK